MIFLDGRLANFPGDRVSLWCGGVMRLPRLVIPTVLFLVASASAGSAAAQRSAANPAPATVTIHTPTAGLVQGPVVQLEATVSDPRILDAVLVVNGASYHVPVEQGAIQQALVAVPGNNRVGVVVEHEGRVARDSLTFLYEGEPMELVVLLTWPSRGEIVDLWIREPGGETCKWDHRSTESGGELLDMSSNAIGFGSQAYVASQARPGRYRIKVHYWGDYGRDDDRSIWSYREMMTQWDSLADQIAAAAAGSARQRTLVAERGRIESRLDAWSTPAAPQTAVHAEAVVFPGTRFERRDRFDIVVHRVGQLTGLGEIEIDPTLITSARRAIAGEGR